MIVSCPNCATGFNLPDSALGATGRKVRCAACGHVWLQRAESALALDSPVTKEPSAGAARDAPGRLPANLLEIDSPIGLSGIGTGVDLWRDGEGAAVESAKPETERPLDAPAEAAEAESAEDADIEIEGLGGEVLAVPELAAKPAPGPEAVDISAAAEEAEAPAKPAAEKPEPADDTIPAAWRAPDLAALAPLVNAIARDEAKKTRAAGASPRQPEPERGTQPAEAPTRRTIEASQPATEESKPIESKPANEMPVGIEKPDATIAPQVRAEKLRWIDSDNIFVGPARMPARIKAVPDHVRGDEAPAETAGEPVVLEGAALKADNRREPRLLEDPAPADTAPILVVDNEQYAKESDAEDQIETPPPAEIEVDLAPERDFPAEIAAAASKHRRLRIGAVAAALALVVGGLVANEVTQQDKAAQLAALSPGGAVHGDTGLGFANVNTQRAAMGETPVLVVTGEVVNTSRRAKAVPVLRGALLGGERELQFWTFTAKTGRLEPGQRAGFETVLRNPVTGATDVRVTFAPAGG